MNNSQALRRKLKALNYKESFGDESIPLINKLLNDLIKASEAYQIQKKQLEIISRNKLESDIDITQTDLKKANILLEKENNEIHSKLIKQEELLSKFEIEKKRLEMENREFQTLLKLQMSGKEENFDKTVDNKNLEIQVNQNLKKQNLSLKEEVNRLRLKYENEFSSNSVKLKKFGFQDEEYQQKEQFYLNQIEFLQNKAEEQEKELNSFKKSKLPELDKMNQNLKLKIENLNVQKQSLENKNNLLEKKLNLKDQNKFDFQSNMQIDINSQLKQKLQNVQQEKNFLENKVQEINKQIQNFENQQQKLVFQLQDIQQAYNREKENNQKLLQENLQQKSEFQNGVKQQQYQENELNLLNDEKSYLVNHNEQYKQQIEFFKNELEKVKGQLFTNDLQYQKLEFNHKQQTENLSKKENLLMKIQNDNYQLIEENNSLKEQNLNQDMYSFKEQTLQKNQDILRKELEEKNFENEKLNQQLYSNDEKIYQFKKDLKIYESKIQELERKNKYQTEEINQRDEKLKNLIQNQQKTYQDQNQINQLEKQLKSSSIQQSEYEKIKKELDNLKLVNLQLQNQIKNLQENQDFIKQERDLEQEQNLKNNQNIEQLQKENLELQFENRMLKQNEENYKNQLGQTGKNIGFIKGEISQKEQQSKELFLQMNKQKLIINQFEQEKNNLINKCQLLEEKLKESEEKSIQFKQKENELLKICQNFDSKLKQKKEEVQKFEEKIIIYQQQKEEFDSEIQLKNQKINNHQQEVQNFKILIENIKKKQETFINNEKKNTKVNLPIEKIDQIQQQLSLMKEKYNQSQQNEIELNKKLQKLDNERDELEENYFNLERKLQNAIQDIKNLKQQIDELLSEKTDHLTIINNTNFNYDNLKDDFKSLTKQYQMLELDQEKIKEINYQLNKEKQDLSSDVQLLINENKTISLELQNQNKKRENFEIKIYNLQEENKKLEFEKSSLEMERSQIQNNCKIFESENNELKRGLYIAEKQIEESQNNLNNLQHQLLSKQNEYQVIISQNNMLKNELTNLQGNFERLEIDLQNNDVENSEKNQELQQLHKKIEGIEFQLSKMRTLIEEKDRYISTLENSYKNLKENFNYLKSKNQQISNKFSDELCKNSKLESVIQQERHNQANLVHTIHKNKKMSSQLESKIESVENLFNFKQFQIKNQNIFKKINLNQFTIKINNMDIFLSSNSQKNQKFKLNSFHTIKSSSFQPNVEKIFNFQNNVRNFNDVLSNKKQQEISLMRSFENIYQELNLNDFYDFDSGSLTMKSDEQKNNLKFLELNQFSQEKNNQNYIFNYSEFIKIPQKIQDQISYKFKCVYCQKKFQTGNALGGHISKSHQFNYQRLQVSNLF